MIKDDETKSAIAIMRDILVKELQIDDERVNIYNQKWKIPADDGVFIQLQLLGSKPIASRNLQEQYGDTFIERQEVNLQEMIQVVIWSKSTEALFRKWEILAALGSVYSQQAQDANGFKIADLPTDLKDISDVEGTARIYMFSATFNVFAWYEKVKELEYYDTFKLRVRTDIGEDTGEVEQDHPEP